MWLNGNRHMFDFQDIAPVPHGSARESETVVKAPDWSYPARRADDITAFHVLPARFVLCSLHADIRASRNSRSLRPAQDCKRFPPY